MQAEMKMEFKNSIIQLQNSGGNLAFATDQLEDKLPGLEDKKEELGPSTNIIF